MDGTKVVCHISIVVTRLSFLRGSLLDMIMAKPTDFETKHICLESWLYHSINPFSHFCKEIPETG